MSEPESWRFGKIPEDDNTMAIVLSIVFHEEQATQKILYRVSDITMETSLKNKQILQIVS